MLSLKDHSLGFGYSRTGVLDTMSSNTSWCRSHRCIHLLYASMTLGKIGGNGDGDPAQSLS